MSFHSYVSWEPCDYRHKYRHGYYNGYHQDTALDIDMEDVIVIMYMEIKKRITDLV
jgi:hypothetical protein